MLLIISGYKFLYEDIQSGASGGHDLGPAAGDDCDALSTYLQR